MPLFEFLVTVAPIILHTSVSKNIRQRKTENIINYNILQEVSMLNPHVLTGFILFMYVPCMMSERK